MKKVMDVWSGEETRKIKFKEPLIWFLFKYINNV